MAVNYSDTVKNDRLQVVLDAIDADVSAGDLQIGDSGFATTLVTIPLNDPAGSVASQQLTFGGMPRTGTASSTGTAAEARIRDGAGTIIVSGLTVGTSGTDIVLNTTSINSGQDVQIDSGVITHG